LLKAISVNFLAGIGRERGRLGLPCLASHPFMVYAEYIETMSEVASALTRRAGGRALYVYYRVHVGQEDAARTAIDTMQANLRLLQPGLHTRLMCRADQAATDPDGVELEATWMEIYEHPDGVSRACETMLMTLASALPVGVFGPRHVEIFAPVGPT
jgi:hypothetical protein